MISRIDEVRSELTRLINQSQSGMAYAFPKPVFGVKRLNIAQASIDDEPGADLDIYISLFDRIDHPESVMGSFRDLFGRAHRRNTRGRRASCTWNGWLHKIPDDIVGGLLDMDWVVRDPHHPLVLLAQQAEEDD